MLSEICVRRPVFATMLVMSLVVLGIFSFRDLGVDLFPRADPATVNVSLALPGASPDEISSSVIEPMEEAISGVSGIDELSARINEGGGTITVRFVLERNLNDAANDVRDPDAILTDRATWIVSFGEGGSGVQGGIEQALGRRRDEDEELE